MDNSTAVTDINHKGGTRSPELLNVTLQLWSWCIQNDLYIIARHVPGKTNVTADRESREFQDNNDWMIDPIIIRPFLKDRCTDLFASRLTKQLASYISWRPDPQSLQSDAFSTNWKHLAGYAFPPFNLVGRVLDKVILDETEIVLVAPVWQAQPWGPLLLSLLVQSSVFLPTSTNLLINPSDPQQSHPMISRLHLSVFRISVADLLISATPRSTQKTYESSWKRWCSWCVSEKSNPISASLNNILSFLSNCFDDGLQYRSINVMRSTLSSTHPKIDGYAVGQHPYVLNVMKGILNNRPPKPQYSYTWDVRQVTKYMKQMGSNASLSLKQISLKLATLLALTCPKRVSSLAKLDINHYRLTPEGAIFTLTTPTKTSRPNETVTAFFSSFTKDITLCPVECLKTYISATKDLRRLSGKEPSILFISHIKPNRAVTTTTACCSLDSVLFGPSGSRYVGLQVTFRSRRCHVSSSQSFRAVARNFMADWSNPSTFQQFYYRPIFSASFGLAVLGHA